MQTLTLPLFRRLEKASSMKIIVDRFVDFMVSFYRLYIHFSNNALMMDKRVQALRKSFLELVNKARA
jgi:hypothetical protein